MSNGLEIRRQAPFGRRNIASIAQRQLAVNDWLATKKAYEAEAARQKKSSRWGSVGRFVGAIGGTLLGLALAPFTAGTSLAFLGTAGMGALGAGIGSGVGTATGQQWAGGMHGQRTSMGQSKNPLTGEMQDIRDPEVERQFEKQIGEFSDQQRDLRTTRALTDAASAYFMPQAMAKAPQGLKTAWNKFAGNVLGNPDARFAVPGLGAERQAIPDPTAALFDTGPTKLINQPGSLTQPAIPIPNQSMDWNPLNSAMGPHLPKTFQGGGITAAAGGGGGGSAGGGGLVPNVLPAGPSISTVSPNVLPAGPSISTIHDTTQSFIEGLSDFGSTPISTLNNEIRQRYLSNYGLIQNPTRDDFHRYLY
jgi:hypothetical protein